MGAGFILTWLSVVYILEPRPEPNSSRKYLIATAIVVVAVVGLALGPRAWRWAQREYLTAKQQRSLAHAKDFFAARDPVAAVAAIEVALSAQPGNAAAWRLAADLVEEAGAREAVQLRRRVVELEPDNPANRLALALTALRFQELTTAFETFATLPDETKALPEAERLALALSLTGQAAPLADAFFADLEKKTPTDARLAFSHAVLLLRHPQVEKAAQALVRKFGGMTPQTVMAGAFDPGDPVRYYRTLASNLRGRTLQLFPPGAGAMKSAEDQDRQLPTLFCMVGKDGLR